MIYDCFPFFNELEILDMRLNILKDVVGKFVIAESTRTHSNKPKPLYFKENEERFSAFKDRIIHVVVDDVPQDKDHWVRERHQRNALVRGLTDAKDGDFLHVSDADEISAPNSLIKAMKQNRFIRIGHVCYYYYFNIVANWDWAHAYVIPWRVFKNSKNTLSDFRHAGCNHKVKGGWHFSYLGGPEQVHKKLEAFAHQELNTAGHHAIVEQAIARKRSFCDLNTQFTTVVSVDQSYPQYILNNVEKYRQMGYIWEGERIVP